MRFFVRWFFALTVGVSSILAYGVCNAAVASAQSISLTGPTSSSSFAEGDDYFTTVQNNPIDGTEKGSLAWYEGFVDDPSPENGALVATSNASGAYFFPRYGGFPGQQQASPIGGDRSIPRYGIDNAVDASKYSLLCMKDTVSARTTFGVLFKSDTSAASRFIGPSDPAFYKSDVFYPYYGANGVSEAATLGRMVNLANPSDFEIVSGSWSGSSIYTIRIDPSVYAGSGSSYRLNWLRLVNPNSAGTVRLTWNLSGLGSEKYMVSIYVDNNNSGRDGFPIKRLVDSPSDRYYDFPTACLPPGTHYFYLGLSRWSNNQQVGSEVFSGYSAPVVVNRKPSGYFTAPSMTSGPEYSADVRGNTWEMDDDSDVKNLNPSACNSQLCRHFSNGSFQNSGGKSYFQAQADPPDVGANESDAQVWLPVDGSNPIDPRYYRYAVVSVSVDPTTFGNNTDRVQKGWVGRYLGAQGVDVLAANKSMDSSDFSLASGEHVYGLDLASITPWRGVRWEQLTFVDNFQYHPLEVDRYTWFFLDYVKLYAENHTANNHYNVKYVIQDADSSSFNVTLRYDTDKQGCDGGVIASLSGIGAGEHSYDWDTSGLPAGTEYYVCAEISDGVGSRTVYSPVHVEIGEYVPSFSPRTAEIVQDIDGDGKSDLVACGYDSSKVKKYLKKPRGAAPTLDCSYTLTSEQFARGRKVSVGIYSDTSFVADMDGDGKSELGAYGMRGGYFYYYWRQPLTGAAGSAYWGVAGDEPALGDYDGDGKTDIAVFRPSEGNWYILHTADGSVDVSFWGLPGDKPVPADYDGDGKDDVAVWRPADGTWYLKLSRTNTERYIQWGLSTLGDIPVPADYDGDGRVDLAVYRPLDGGWYVQHISDGSTSYVQLGSPRHVPSPQLDINGDGAIDYVVAGPSTNKKKKDNKQFYLLYAGTGVSGSIYLGKASDSIPKP